MTKTRMAKNAIRNISKLIVGFIIYIAIELSFKTKQLAQYIAAKLNGYKSHTEFIQFLLDTQNAKH